MDRREFDQRMQALSKALLKYKEKPNSITHYGASSHAWKVISDCISYMLVGLGLGYLLDRLFKFHTKGLAVCLILAATSFIYKLSRLR